jgi:hypothetical protein
MYGLPGIAIGLLIASAIFAIRRPHHWQFEILPVVTICLSFGNLAIYIAERKGKVESIGEIRSPDPLSPNARSAFVLTGSAINATDPRSSPRPPR